MTHYFDSGPPLEAFPRAGLPVSVRYFDLFSTYDCLYLPTDYPSGSRYLAVAGLDPAGLPGLGTTQFRALLLFSPTDSAVDATDISLLDAYQRLFLFLFFFIIYGYS